MQAASLGDRLFAWAMDSLGCAILLIAELEIIAGMQGSVPSGGHLRIVGWWRRWRHNAAACLLPISPACRPKAEWRFRERKLGLFSCLRREQGVSTVVEVGGLLAASSLPPCLPPYWLLNHCPAMPQAWEQPPT